MSRVVVVGAGAIGLCCAYALRRRGFEVLVLDRGLPGSGASHGNGGWICPSFSAPLPAPGITAASLRGLVRPDSPFYIKPRLNPSFLRWLWRFRQYCNDRAYQQGLDALAQLNSTTMALFDALARDGVPFEMHQQGLLFLFRSIAAAREEAHKQARMERYGYPRARWLHQAELRAEEPCVSPEVAAGLLLPSERHIRPESLTEGLLEKVRAMGVEVRAHEAVTGFAHDNGMVTGVRTTQQHLPATHVVLSAGIWTARLAAMLGHSLPLEAGKGYSVTMSSAALAIRRPLYFAEAHVGCSPYKGAVRILGTMELSGINHWLMPQRLTALKRAPARYLRGWRDGDLLEEWIGLRPLTPDGLPIIGPVPGAENVIVAAGHAMLGITLAPSTGEAVADLIAGTVTPVSLAAFRVARF